MDKQSYPTCSIIIVNWNGLEDTCECIKSLLEDGCKKEIIVWDNGSEKNEAKLLKKEFQHNIRAIRSPKNLGFARANNEAIELSTAEIVILLNNDTIVTKNWLMPIKEIFTKMPDIVAVQPKILNWYNRQQFDYAGACGGFLDLIGYPFTRGRIFFTLENDHGQYNADIEVDWISGACFAVRKEEYIMFKGLDCHFFAYMEEIDLCWRLKTGKKKLLCCPKSIIFHKGCKSWSRRPFKKKYLEHRNNLIMLFKNLPYKYMLPIISLRYVYEFTTILYHLSIREWKNALAVLLAMLYCACNGWFYLLSGTNMRSLNYRKIIIVNEFFFLGRRTYAKICDRS